MIYKRVAARLRAQDWLAITIELAIVILGVFIGTQVSNWNQDRADKRAAERLVGQLAPKFQQFEELAANDVRYYRTVQAYAKVAQGGFARDPAVSDNNLVIAAYQATQLNNFNQNKFANGSLINVEEVRKIDDAVLRDRILDLIAVDSSLLDLPGEGSPYREKVRSVIPTDVQQAIMDRCGDRNATPPAVGPVLPPTCDLKLDPAIAAKVAAALRAEADLPQMLTSHIAHVTRHINSMIGYGTVFLHNVTARITETRR